MTDPVIGVVGSVVKDRICRVGALPMPGESAIVEDVRYALGGKGANQAVAAGRLGAATFLLAKVGEDPVGAEAIDSFRDAPLLAVVLGTPAAPSGEATVIVDEQGENMIVVALGANLLLDANDVEAHRDMLAKAKVLVTQFEVSDSAIRAVAELGDQTEATTILNAAPMREDAVGLLPGFDVAVLNRTEAEVLAGVGISSVDDAFAAVRAIHDLGVAQPVVTLGPAGAVFLHEGRVHQAPAPRVDAVDVTGAGDAFVGALAAFLAAGVDLDDAVPRACRAAALATTGIGARAAYPDRDALEAFEQKLGIEV